MGRQLKITVHVTGEDGRPKALLPGAEPTSAEAEQITNPDVWEVDEEPAGGRAATRASRPGRRAEG